jgi:ArsR family transcriptional regulator, arsenate/arsenite/antimonite-responsive transcriptional repressor
MKINDASQLFAALGHESRLAIFRALVETGPEGLNASAIGIKLDIPPATLSFHLAHLVRVKLIKRKKASRFIYYSANYGVMDNLIAFLTRNCCQGTPCLPKSAAARKIIRNRK